MGNRIEVCRSARLKEHHLKAIDLIMCDTDLRIGNSNYI